MGLLSNLFSGSGALVPTTESNGVQQTYSSFGIDQTTIGPEFPASALYRGERYLELEYRDRYYTCRQHDGKLFNWKGAAVQPSHRATQPLLGNQSSGIGAVALEQRRPCAPYRIARIITQGFTGMVFGDGRWPTPQSTDAETQDFANALVEAASLPSKMSEARNLGGATGTAVLSWWFNKQAEPRVRVHHARTMHVLDWDDFDELIPAHVVELTQFARTEFSQKTKKMEKVAYWSRRDWTQDADVVFFPQPVQEKDPVKWEIDKSKSTKHGDGFCHVVWIHNLVNDDIDGVPDYEGLYEQMDTLDLLNSVHVGGTVKNLDPTLVLKLDPDVDATEAEIVKGSDNALSVGSTGGADYLTLGSDVITGGALAVKNQRDQILETAQCVVPDPDKVVAAGTSSLALKLLYAPMLGKASLMRTQYGENGIQRLLNQMIESARRLMPDNSAEAPEQRYITEPVLDEETGEQLVDPVTGEPMTEQVHYMLNLPPRIEKEEIVGADGLPTGQFEEREIERNPGKGLVTLKWPDYFPKTPADRQAEASAGSTANGGQAVMSQQTACEEYAAANGLDPIEEFARLRDEMRARAEAATAAASGMFPPAGFREDGPPAHEQPIADVPEAAEAEPVEQSAPADDPGVVTPAPGGPSVELAPATVSKLMTANEARAMLGLPPATLNDGVTPDPDGNMSIDAYATKKAAEAEAAMEPPPEAPAPPVPPAPAV